VVSVGGSLGAVLGLFFLLAWAMRRGVPGAVGLLPAEALEVLGRAPLAGRQQVHLVRLGSKLVLVSVSPTGTETLSEVTEPDEVQRLIAICRQTHTTSAASMFRQALDRFATHKEPSDA
jgi:flagellar biogenesis protein FliO